MKRTASLMSVASVSILFCTAGALAQGVGNLPALPIIIPGNAATGGWVVGPVEVVRDPNGPKWIKHFTDPNGGPFTAIPGQMFSVIEQLYIAPQLPWSDWHEEILTPGWDWAGPIVMLANGSPASGLVITNTPGVAPTGGTLGLDFDPLFPGTQVLIRKQLQYTGTLGTVFVGTVEIAQYPTPEPASLGLLAIGSLLSLRRRRA